jgi:serine/threonine-protein kinase
MSPEQAFGEKSLDHRADIWSLGMVLYEVMTGTLLTRSNELEEVFRRLISAQYPRLDSVDPAIPEDIARMVAAMLERDVDQRLHDLREVQTVLERYAPEIEKIEFAPASSALSFDEPSSVSGPGIQKPQTDTSKSQPLKLAPGALKRSAGQRAAGGTIVVERETAASDDATLAAPVRVPSPLPAPPSPSAPVAPTVSGPIAGPVAAPPPPRAASAAWMWVLAMLILVACGIVLLTQLR